MSTSTSIFQTRAKHATLLPSAIRRHSSHNQTLQSAQAAMREITDSFIDEARSRIHSNIHDALAEHEIYTGIKLRATHNSLYAAFEMSSDVKLIREPLLYLSEAYTAHLTMMPPGVSVLMFRSSKIGEITSMASIRIRELVTIYIAAESSDSRIISVINMLLATAAFDGMKTG